MEVPEPESHSCSHCRVTLQAYSGVPQPISWIMFPHTVNQARRAADSGCVVFGELIANYSRRSLYQLLKIHWNGECEWCRDFSQCLRHVIRSFSYRPFRLVLEAKLHCTKIGPTLLSFAYLDSADGNPKERFNAYTYARDNTASLLPSIDLDVSSDETMRSVSQWISTCTCVSKSIDAAPFRPSRVVDLGDGSDTDRLTVRRSYGVHVPAYICLSYCWGGSQSLVCLKSNLDSSGDWKFPISDAPATFRDAFCVTRRLGFQFMWIDSLCIIQDDSKEVEREILQMPQIYQNAEVTICASSAESSRKGFLHPRPDYSQLQMSLNLPKGRQGTIYLDRHVSSNPPLKEPLSTRAWALQERLLSPRLLEFGWRTARWMCSCCNSYAGQNDLSLTTHPELQSCIAVYSLYIYVTPHFQALPRSRQTLFQSWTHLVNIYSHLILSKPEDRLAAIGGMAQVVESTIGVRYLAGLWDYEELPALLQWNVDSPAHRLLPRPRPYRAPSWSWAGIDNAVTARASQEVVTSFKVLSAKSTGGFSKTAHGMIVIEGPVRSGMWWHEDERLQIGDAISPLRKTGDRWINALILWPDCADEFVITVDGIVTTLHIELTFAAIGRVNWDRRLVRGLILMPTESKKEYFRVGLFQAPDKGNFNLELWRTETIILI